MNLNTAILATLTIIVITQVLRQLLPNLFACVWQLALYELVPTGLTGHRWFKDKRSLFFFSKDEILIHTYPVFTQPNLRNVVLLGGLSFWMLLNFNLEDIRQGIDIITLILLGAAFLVIPIKVASEGINNFNPDYLILLASSIVSYLIALQFVIIIF
ncbi:hypothetical protein L1267_17825 [Pseudoalteromonas sp. OFAV1]|uniref:hypothetical protein n=1 Tax=Pseudoalteromonas sp. OFAV1 TaxID=2908892 RepID=UPI001F1B75EE|nr:hypothetical protein [Pseudoalteromonas sp. OFAV1]MCF2902231.1 hypothetical protein [Pseudoalteromonas sp. OFAV1]